MYYYKLLLSFTFAILIVFVPTWFYVESKKPPEVEFKFVPNAIAQRKPVYVQLLKTQAEVDAVKKAPIRDADLATVGAFVNKGSGGLTVVPKVEIDSAHYILKEVGFQEDRTMSVNGYNFVPNTIWTAKVSIGMINNRTTLKSAKTIKNLGSRDLLSLNAAVNCPTTGYCYVISKQVLENLYIVNPLSEV